MRLIDWTFWKRAPIRIRPNAVASFSAGRNHFAPSCVSLAATSPPPPLSSSSPLAYPLMLHFMLRCVPAESFIHFAWLQAQRCKICNETLRYIHIYWGNCRFLCWPWQVGWGEGAKVGLQTNYLEHATSEGRFLVSFALSYSYNNCFQFQA